MNNVLDSKANEARHWALSFDKYSEAFEENFSIKTKLNATKKNNNNKKTDSKRAQPQHTRPTTMIFNKLLLSIS